MSAESLYTTTVGAGPDLVLIHGWGLHGGVWTALLPHLSGRFRVTCVDLPGHGYSRGEGFSLDGAARALAAVVPAHAVWLGWSLGGMVALAAAARPDGPRRLLLSGASARFAAAPDWPHGMPADVLAGFAGQLAEDYRATLLRFLALQTRGAEVGRDTLRTLRECLFERGEPRPAALAGGLRALAEADLRPLLPAIGAPTLLLHGERDTLSPLAAAAATAERLPHGRLVAIPGAGHAPFLSHPERFLGELLEFLYA